MCAFEGNNYLSMLLFRCCHSWTFPPSNFTIFHCALSFFILHFQFCILHSFSLCLYHCCIVRQCLGTPYQCLIGPSYNYCCWALDDQHNPLFSTRDRSPSLSSCCIMIFQSLHMSFSATPPAGVIVGTLLI